MHSDKGQKGYPFYVPVQEHNALSITFNAKLNGGYTMKKLISLLLICAMTLSGTVAAFALTAEDNVSYTLAGYGIIDADAPKDAFITRGEFAHVIANLMGYSQQVETTSPKTDYWDVPENYEFAKDISLLSQIGILNGISDTLFSPDESVTYEQAIKVLVTITGYGEIALSSGGWPNGYIAMAAKNNMLGSVSLSNPFPRKDFYKLVYNTLDVKLLGEVIKRGDGETLVKTEDTLRNKLAYGVDSTIYKHKGVIVANSFTYTTAPYSDLYDDEVVIENKTEGNTFIYKIGKTNAFDLVGCEVDFYFKEISGGYELLSVKPSISNEVIKVKAEDFGVKSGNEISYLNENGKTEKLSLEEGAKVVYNGSRVLSYGEDIFELTDGYISFYNNDDDQAFELAMVWKYENAIALSFDGQRFDFKTGADYDNLTALFVDKEDRDKKMVVRDKEGKTVESFDSPHTVSICANRDKTRYSVFVSDVITEGVFESYGDDVITVNGVDYKAAASLGSNMLLGKNYMIYVDYEGKLAFAEDKEIINYAYVLEYGKDNKSPLNGRVSAKLLIPGQMAVGSEVDEDDPDAVPEKFLLLQNEGAKVLNFAESVKCNGKKYSGNDLISLLGEEGMNVISYEVNENEEITEITPLKKVGGALDDRYQYDVNDRVFGGTTVDQESGFGINDATKGVCVPADDKNNINTDATDEDLALKMDIRKNDKVGYRVAGYDYDEFTKKARFIVFLASMDATLAPSINTFADTRGLVTSVKNIVNSETGEEVKEITLLSGSAEKILRPIEITSANSRINDIREGDLIVYKVNKNDMMQNAFIVQHIPDLKNEIVSDIPSTAVKRVYGRAGKIEFDGIDTYNKKLIVTLEIYVGDEEYPLIYKMKQSSPPHVYIYNTNDKTYKSGNLKEIRPEGEKIYLYEQRGSGEIEAMVLIR